MADEITVKVVVDELDSLAKTPGLNLTKAQKDSLTTNQTGARKALETEDWKNFHKYVKNIIDILQKASVATGKVSDTLKKLGEAQDILQKELSGLYKKRDELKGKITSSKGEGTVPKKVADEIFNKSAEKGKIFSNAKNPQELKDTGVILSRADKIIELLNGKSRSSLTNEMAQQAGLRDKQSGLAALRLRDETQNFVKDTQAEISATDDEITAKEAESVALSEEINKIAAIAPEADKALEGLYKRLVDIAGLVNKEVSAKISTANAKTAATQPGVNISKDVGQLGSGGGTSLGKAFKQLSIYTIAVRAVKKALSEAVQTVKELDKYLTEQAMVTGKTREETYALVGQYQELALACGATTKEIAQVTTEYMKQGKSTAEALVLTEAAVKAAKVARVSVGDSVNYLTTALNGFRLEATEAMRVSDIFASVAAASATDYDELAIALSKVASQANLAGMSIEYTTALLTKGLETTREAPETMGTALKTIIARMREMSDYGETLEGDTDVNNVESQLAYVGIALKNEQGELRSTEEVLDELGQKWDTLNKNQQAALAKALAGTRQQSRLIAMMDDYERVIELQEIAERSTGATSAQAGVYLEGMEAALNKIQVAWEKIVMTITESDIIIGFFNLAGGILEHVGDFLENTAAQVGVFSILALIGATMLGNKLKENALAKESLKLKNEETLIENKKELITLRAGLEAKKTLVDKKKELLIEKQTLLVKQQQLVADKKAALAKNPQNIKLKKELEEEEGQLKKYQDEYNNAKLEYDEAKLNLDKDNTRIKTLEYENNQIMNQIGLVGTLMTMVSGLQGLMLLFKPIYSTILFLQKLQNKEKREEYVATLRQQALEAKGLRKKLLNAGASLAESAGKIPYVGWIIGIAILAALGIGIAVAAVNMNKYKNSADGAAESVNELSNEIYTLNETANAIANVTSQFDKLDDKVIKTKEDIEEMNSLLDSAGDSLSSEEDAKYNQETYKSLQDNESRRRYLELAQQDAENQLSQKRQEQLNIINALSSTERAKLLDDNTNNSAYLETQSAVRATVNSYIYDTIDALEELGSYTTAELKYTEDLTVALMEEAKALDALDYANNQQAVADLVQELAELDSTAIFMDENYSFTERIQAFKDIKNALADDQVAWEAFSAAYQEWNTFAQMNEEILKFIENTSLSIDQINELYAGYSKLQKAGIDITREAYTTALESSMYDLDSNLSNLESVISTHFGYMLTEGEEFVDQWNAIISTIGDTFAIGILDMGQNMEKFQNTINNFYDKSSEWATMKESEKMEFIADNAELFAGEGGEKLLQAFESGDYNALEQALKNQMDSEDGMTAQRLAEVRRTLAVEEARIGEDRNAAYIQSLKEYEAYLMNGNDLYKASLELRLEQEEAQLDKYKEYLEKQQEALTDSLEKRKEAYQDYFDSINENEEDEDYEEEANRLITNISKLSSSTNADAMQKTAELEQELRDLEEERLQTLRERAQEAVIANIDTTIEEINDKFDKLLESNQALLVAMRGELDSPLEFLTDMIVSKADDGLTAYGMEEFLQELQGTYGSVIGNDVFENMTVREENGQLILNINGQEIMLGAEDQQSVYTTVMEALRAVGLR